MSANLPAHYAQQFATNVQLLLQQKGGRLRQAVTFSTGYVGKQASPVDQIGAVAARKVTTRFADMGRVDAPVDRRWVYPVDYDLPQLIDKFDKLRLLTDPESVYVTNALYAMGRSEDDEILAALFGTAKTGEQGGTSTSFLAGNVVSVNVGGAPSGLNAAKLRRARRLLQSHDVDDEEEIYCVITSEEHDALLNEPVIVSGDFNDQKVLVDGVLKRWLGINFIRCERLTTGTDDQAGTSRQIPLWVKSGMHLAIWQDFMTDVTQRKDLQGLPWQAYVCGTYGATRLEEKKIVKIWARTNL